MVVLVFILLYRSPHYRKMQHGTSKKGSKYSLAVLLHTWFCLNKRPTDGGEKWSAKQYCQLCLKTYSIWVCNIKNPCSGRFDVGVWFGGYGSRHGHFTSGQRQRRKPQVAFFFLRIEHFNVLQMCIHTTTGLFRTLKARTVDANMVYINLCQKCYGLKVCKYMRIQVL